MSDELKDNYRLERLGGRKQLPILELVNIYYLWILICWLDLLRPIWKHMFEMI